MAVTLRPYQSAGVASIREKYSQGYRSVLFVLPTGGGKTVVFSHIACTTSARGKRVLILAHREELVKQASKTLRKEGVTHGIIKRGYTPFYAAHVQVASVQTLGKRLGTIPFTPDLIVIDEAHHANAGTWRKVVEAYPKAYILGVTATPVRGDGSGLGVEAGGVFQAMVLGPTTRELMDMGFLVEPIIHVPDSKVDLSGIRTQMGDYDKKQLASVMDKPTITGDAVAHYRKLCHGVPAVAFCVSVAHAEHVAAEFRKAGYRAYAVDGAMEDDDRARILNGLGNGTVDVVCSCDLISEGTDIPAIGCAILLRPTKSLGLFLQQVGRALRPCEGKDRAVIIDHVGNVGWWSSTGFVANHGFPDQDREWSLAGAPKRKGKKQEVEAEIKVLQCRSCYAIFAPASACPVCGSPVAVPAPKQRKLEQQDGELREVKLSPEQKKAQEAVRRTEIAKARTLEDLQRIAKERGYKPGWAKHVWHSKKNKDGVPLPTTAPLS